MADSKTPRYTVKHIDGVMHLTVNSDAKPKVSTAELRPLPPAVEKVER